jgi:heme/copper-type cytochrome/quinol oxidase subunit 2
MDKAEGNWYSFKTNDESFNWSLMKNFSLLFLIGVAFYNIIWLCFYSFHPYNYNKNKNMTAPVPLEHLRKVAASALVAPTLQFIRISRPQTK